LIDSSAGLFEASFDTCFSCHYTPLQRVSMGRSNQYLNRVRIPLIDSNPDQRRPPKLGLSSQGVLPTVVIDSPMDVEVIECRGPVTTMAGKDFMAFERVRANTRGFIKKNGKHQKRKAEDLDPPGDHVTQISRCVNS
jgi:hypothetical protein